MNARPRPTDAQFAAGPRVIDHGSDPAALRAIEYVRAGVDRFLAACAAEPASTREAATGRDGDATRLATSPTGGTPCGASWPLSPEAVSRFWAKVNKRSGRSWNGSECWEWLGRPDRDGYGSFKVGGTRFRAHRLAYELTHGPIEPGLVPDHLCRWPTCVNPAHLEPVTHKVNSLRGIGPIPENATKTHCTNGHHLSGDNLIVRPCGKRMRRECRECKQASHRRYLQRKKESLA